jgi:hypothetical protein
VDQVVPERQPLTVLGEYLRGQRFGQHRPQRADRLVGDLAQRGHREARTEHRRRPEQLHRCRGQEAQVVEHGHREGRQGRALANVDCPFGIANQCALGEQHPDDLTHEQRVTSSAGQQSPQPWAERCARQLLGQSMDVGLGQRSQPAADRGRRQRRDRGRDLGPSR